MPANNNMSAAQIIMNILMTGALIFSSLVMWQFRNLASEIKTIQERQYTIHGEVQSIKMKMDNMSDEWRSIKKENKG